LFILTLSVSFMPSKTNVFSALTNCLAAAMASSAVYRSPEEAEGAPRVIAPTRPKNTTTSARLATTINFSIFNSPDL
jgi:hypothetical protein